MMKQTCLIKKNTGHDDFILPSSEPLYGFRIKALSFLLIIYFSISGLFAQNQVVTGKITDETGAGLIGATVTLKGTSKGTITDAGGKYQISANQPTDILVFSFVGYQTIEKEIGQATEIDVNLVPNIQSLNEVVVVGYGTQRKSDLTGAVVSVKSEDIARMPAGTTDQILQGRAAGVSITSNSGAPGSDMLIRVRGIGTINDASPLFVIDGFPVSDIKFLNPTDIASMEILKDASSTAIYGARGANGVILITTKTGKAMEAPIVSFDSYYGTSEMWKTPSTLNASDWGMLKNEAAANDGNPKPFPNYNSLGNGTNWIKEVTRKAQTRNLNVSITGGNDRLNYFLSANNFLQEGIINKSDFERTSVRINTTIKVKDWLTVGENLTLESSIKHAIDESDEWNAILIEAVANDPTTKVKDADGHYYISDNGIDMRNPVQKIDLTDQKDEALRVIGNVFGEVNILKSLTFKSNFGVDRNNGESYNFNPTYDVYNSAGIVDGKGNSTSVLTRSPLNEKAWNWSNYFTFANTYGASDISAMLGVEASQVFSDNFSAAKSNYFTELKQFRNFDNSLNPNATVSGVPDDKKMQSYFGRLNYTFDGKYLLTANFRRDGSSVFGPDNRYGNFPSFSAGWKINKESFMSNLTFISNLKLRAGWGQIGNDKIPAYGYSTLASLGQLYVFDDQITDGTAFLQNGNKKLKWETTATTNFGVDFGILNDRLTMSAEYYIKKTTDMLVNIPRPGFAGVQVFNYENIGAMENSGFEIELNFKNKAGDFYYEIGGNFATFTNKVTDLGGKPEIFSASLRDAGQVSVTRVDEPIAQFYGRKTQGLFQTEADVQAWKDKDGNLLQADAQPGDIRYAKNTDNTGLYEGIIGNPLPKFTYGLTAKLEYKNLDLNMFWQGVYGNDVFNAGMVYTDRPDASHNMSTRMLNRWTGPNSTNDAHYPRLSTVSAENMIYSDRFVEDGSYIRLKNLQIGYTLTKNLSQTLKIQKLRIYVGATNLLTFTKYKGFDPEIGEGRYGSLDLGVDRATYPQSRTYLLGLNLTF